MKHGKIIVIIRLTICVSFVLFYAALGIAVLGFSQKTNSQEVTSHNELHKAFESALQNPQTKDCYGRDIRFARKSGFSADQSTGEINPAQYRAECAGNNSQLIYAVNLAGDTLTSSTGQVYMSDPFNVIVGEESIDDTWYYLAEEKSLSWYFFPGRYKVVIYEKANNCAGWQINFMGQSIVGLGGVINKKYEIVADTEGSIVTVGFYPNGCTARFYAIELWRIKRQL